MASTLTRLLVHVTFSTKRREPLIAAAIERRLHEYIGGICRERRSPLLEIGGVADHLHMLVDINKTESLSDLMLNVKRDSSRWMHDEGQASFEWQDGYFGFSIGESGITDVRAYIQRQKERHRAVSFQDEVRAFCTKYGVTLDERYAWT